MVQRYGSPEEAPEVWAKLSPITYLADISSPISIHHGDLDRKVSPLGWRKAPIVNLAGLSSEKPANLDREYRILEAGWVRRQ